MNALTLNAQNVDNQAGADLNSAATTINAANAITNEGRIEGDTVATTSATLNNTATIIGNHVTLSLTTGTLISGAFTGLLERYRLRCANGHEWEAQGRKISEGSWCPQCSRAVAGQRSRSADGLERLKAAACAKGGRCLALRYVGTTGEYECECGEGHRWKTTGSHLLAGHWCAQCAAQQRGASLRTADGLDRLQATAEARGGACLTNAYTGRLKQYRFRCARGHEWETEGGVVLSGSWCKQCADDQQRSTLDQMQEVALSRGGRCLSVKYQNSNAKLTWECHRGHVWDAAPSSVLQGSWCMNCWRLGISKRGVKRKRYDIDG